jgi:hypothetical protein
MTISADMLALPSGAETDHRAAAAGKKLLRIRKVHLGLEKFGTRLRT